MKNSFLHAAILLCTALIGFPGPSPAQNLLDPLTQPKFVNPLPVPSAIDGRSGGTFTISISQFYQDLGLRDPATGQPMLNE